MIYADEEGVHGLLRGRGNGTGEEREKQQRDALGGPLDQAEIRESDHRGRP